MIDNPSPPTRARRAVLTSRAAVGAVGAVGAAIAAIAIASLAGCAPNNDSDRCAYNEQGLSYGSAVNTHPGCDAPDLIQTEATNGNIGYVYEKDLAGYVPKNPSEAAKANKTNSAGYTVTVYESDGVTPVGEFFVGGAPPSSEAQ